MVLYEFLQGKDYQQYPESVFVRDNPRIAQILGASKPHEQMVFAWQSRWWHSIAESKLHLKNLLAYNAGVIFSFGSSHYQIDLNYELMNQILHDEVTTPYLQFRIYSPDQQVTIKSIKVKINDDIIELNPEDGIYKNVDYHAETKLSLDADNNVVVTRLNPIYDLFFDLIFNVPEYSEIQLIEFDYDGDIKMMVYNSPVSAIIYSDVENKMIQVDHKFLDKKSRQDFIELMSDFSVYQNAELIYVSKLGSHHLSLYLDMKFYDQEPDPEYTAVRSIQLILEPVEKTYVKFYQRKYHDLISLGTFHKFHDNLYRLYQNSVVLPAFTEFTIYKNDIHIPKGTFESKSRGIDMVGPYDLGYLQDMYQYEYPYGLELLRKGFDYFDYNTLIEYDTDEFLYIEYEVIDRDAVVLDLDFNAKQAGKIIFGKPITTDIEYPAIMWRFINTPIRKFKTHIRLLTTQINVDMRSLETSTVNFTHSHKKD